MPSLNMDTFKLLSRDQFRSSVFERDHYKCVFCDLPAADAHHIIERRLWTDGGYYLCNGVSVCYDHHIQCETTQISVENVRIAAGITKYCLPEHLYSDQIYDKWGNPIMSNGTRLKGDLFYDESVQKILKQGGILDLFVDYVKYPRTYHLPWSLGVTEDDRIHKTMNHFFGKRVIVTEKLDGENTTGYRNYIHARSVDSRNHPSRDWVKTFWASVSYELPEGWRVCGENMYARHSIGYDNLKSYFYGFSIWTDKNQCLSWDETQIWLNLLGIESVPVLYDDIYNEFKIKSLWSDNKWSTSEGYVLRTADSFGYSEFRKNVGKFVRANHVTTVKHWMHGQPINQNGLVKGE